MPYTSAWRSPFQFQLTVPNLQHTVFFCDSITLPDITGTPVKIATPFVDVMTRMGRLVYGMVTATVLVDTKMQSYLDLYQWMWSAGRPENAGVGRSPADLTVLVNDSQNHPILKAVFPDIFPMHLGDIQYSTKNEHVDVQIFTVMFATTYFTLQSTF
jgi:hypothetical protein